VDDVMTEIDPQARIDAAFAEFHAICDALDLKGRRGSRWRPLVGIALIHEAIDGKLPEHPGELHCGAKRAEFAKAMAAISEHRGAHNGA
jgi:hypothetical protein